MLSKKAQYAFRALAFLVEKYDDGPVRIAEISRKKKIPLKFLEHILLELRKEGYLQSKKGKGGGYALAMAPRDVSLAAIIRIVNGPIAMLPCASLHFYERCRNCNEKECGLHDVMVDVRDVTLRILERKTLQDLIS